MPQDTTNDNEAIEALRVAMAVIAEDVSMAATTRLRTSPRTEDLTDRALAVAGRDLITLAEACMVLRKRAGRSVR